MPSKLPTMGSRRWKPWAGTTSTWCSWTSRCRSWTVLLATRAIRNLADPKKARVPIIALTAHALTGDADRCLDAGMDGYISKPINRDELIERVEQLAAARRTRRLRSPWHVCQSSLARSTSANLVVLSARKAYVNGLPPQLIAFRRGGSSPPPWSWRLSSRASASPTC